MSKQGIACIYVGKLVGPNSLIGQGRRQADNRQLKRAVVWRGALSHRPTVADVLHVWRSKPRLGPCRARAEPGRWVEARLGIATSPGRACSSPSTSAFIHKIRRMGALLDSWHLRRASACLSLTWCVLPVLQNHSVGMGFGGVTKGKGWHGGICPPQCPRFASTPPCTSIDAVVGMQGLRGCEVETVSIAASWTHLNGIVCSGPYAIESCKLRLVYSVGMQLTHVYHAIKSQVHQRGLRDSDGFGWGTLHASVDAQGSHILPHTLPPRDPTSYLTPYLPGIPHPTSHPTSQGSHILPHTLPPRDPTSYLTPYLLGIATP
ncbi:hypothetical protein BD779DRAFT_1478586 [Infundibulicybe gibba]|nr:hypothetical protein BD779DRAFT_1478586 [Infundibulicybe gibba]